MRAVQMKYNLFSSGVHICLKNIFTAHSLKQSNDWKAVSWNVLPYLLQVEYCVKTLIIYSNTTIAFEEWN